MTHVMMRSKTHETIAQMHRLAELWHEQPDQGPEEGCERDTHIPLVKEEQNEE